jgi:hypothetical protein
MVSPATADQIDAAYTHTSAIAHTIARRHGRPALDVTDHPAFAQVLRELQGRISLGLLSGCAHIEAPTACVWRAWRPDVLLCAACFIRHGRDDEIAGTLLEFECDVCNQTDVEGLACVAHVGAVLVLMFVCRSCQALG